MQTTPCVPCCSTPLTTNIPGAQGETGIAGTDGINAFSVLQVGFNVAGVAGTAHTLTVDESGWMVIGQVIVADGPVHLIVTAVPDSTSVTVEELAYTGDTTGAIAAGAKISPSGVQGEVDHPLSVYGTGSFTLLTTAAPGDLVALSGTPLTLVITDPGTYLLFACVTLDFVAAENATERTITLRLRRTNNTASDVTNTPIDFIVPVVAAGSAWTVGIVALPVVVYHTANSDDSISVYGRIGTALTGGTVDATDGYIVAVKLNSATS